MNDNNVIKFPPQKTNDESNLRLEDIETKLNMLMPFIYTILSTEGYDIIGDDTGIDILESVLLVHDSIRSAIYDSLEIYHPLQDFAYESYSGMLDDEEVDAIDCSLLTTILPDKGD